MAFAVNQNIRPGDVVTVPRHTGPTEEHANLPCPVLRRNGDDYFYKLHSWAVLLAIEKQLPSGDFILEANGRLADHLIFHRGTLHMHPDDAFVMILGWRSPRRLLSPEFAKSGHGSYAVFANALSGF